MIDCLAKILIVCSLLVSNVALSSAEPYPEINNQLVFQKFMVSTAQTIYEKMNGNVKFPVSYGTNSPLCETEAVLVKPIMFKARGVNLQAALASLLEIRKRHRVRMLDGTSGVFLACHASP